MKITVEIEVPDGSPLFGKCWGCIFYDDHFCQIFRIGISAFTPFKECLAARERSE
jgi:hypothetical protein